MNSFRLAGRAVLNRVETARHPVDYPDSSPSLKSNLDLAAYLKQGLSWTGHRRKRRTDAQSPAMGV